MNSTLLSRLVCRGRNNVKTFVFFHSFNRSRSFAPVSVRMSSLHVKNCEDDERLHINLDLQVGSAKKSLNLYRMKNEELGLALERLRTNLEKKTKKKSKKMKKDKTDPAQAEGGQQDEEGGTLIQLEILHNGQSVPLSILNDQAWISGAVLRVGEESISVTYNPPSVTLRNICPLMMEGYPLFPEVEFEFCNVDSCEFHWKTLEKKYIDGTKKNIRDGIFDFTDSCKGYSYTPRKDDIDKYVLLMCVPKSGEKVGKPQAVISESVVVKGPVMCPFEKIQQNFTQDRSQFGEFRVISYNILAEVYTNTELAKTHLFVHCPDYAVEMNYRKQILLKEITGYQADLVCLQEVDKSVFTKHLAPGLNLQGFEGFFRPKKGGVSEGCAMFVRRDKFKVVNQLDIVLSEYLESDESCRDLWEKICEVKALKEKIEQRSSILQVTIVESTEKPGQFVCLANTHLYFHPRADNIRLIHGATALRYLQAISSAYKQEGKTISVVFCGDFNSSPDVGVYQLMTSQFVQDDFIDWMSGGEEEALRDVELSHPMNIISACGTPDFTHYAPPIQCTLDYIFVESTHLDVMSSVPLPDLADVQAYSYLPNPLIPSDHLALVSDLKFKS